jgi:hypothetical protein
MFVLKVVAAFCLGAGLLAGLQTAWLTSVQRHLRSEQAKAGVPRMGPEIGGPFKPTLDARAILPKYGPIDTREGQRLAVESAARRIDLQVRAAQNAVPLPPRIHTGIRR